MKNGNYLTIINRVKKLESINNAHSLRNKENKL